MGNVTTLADNATINSTQIENLGAMYMLPEEQSLKLMSTYGQDRVQYVLVFTVVYLTQSSASSGTSVYYAVPANVADEGKWMWMARISGQAKDRLINETFMDADAAWTDEFAFGNVSTSNQWQWNTQGMDTTFYKLMTTAQKQYADKSRWTSSNDRDRSSPNILQASIRFRRRNNKRKQRRYHSAGCTLRD